MIASRKKADAKSFLCAAGILSHYIGDACQPLHGSMHSDGLNGASTGVHSAYEEKMVDKFAEELRQQLDVFKMSSLGPALKHVSSGYQAAQAAIELMRRTHQRLAPERICEAYNDLGGGSSQALLTAFWAKLGKETVACIADGTRTLTMLWSSAYSARKTPVFSGKIE